jgi:hypothetical protein
VWAQPTAIATAETPGDMEQDDKNVYIDDIVWTYSFQVISFTYTFLVHIGDAFKVYQLHIQRKIHLHIKNAEYIRLNHGRSLAHANVSSNRIAGLNIFMHTYIFFRFWASHPTE